MTWYVHLTTSAFATLPVEVLITYTSSLCAILTLRDLTTFWRCKIMPNVNRTNQIINTLVVSSLHPWHLHQSARSLLSFNHLGFRGMNIWLFTSHTFALTSSLKIRGYLLHTPPIPWRCRLTYLFTSNETCKHILYNLSLVLHWLNQSIDDRTYRLIPSVLWYYNELLLVKDLHLKKHQLLSYLIVSLLDLWLSTKSPFSHSSKHPLTRSDPKVDTLISSRVILWT